MRALLGLCGLLFAGLASGEDLEEFSRPPAEFRENLGDYRSPLIREDGSRVTAKEEWPARRAEIVEQWTALLGQWPEVITDPKVEVLQSESREDFVQETVRFLWTPDEFTTGYLLTPKSAKERQVPGVVVVYYEPETAIGWGKENRDFAYQLARRGFATLSIGTSEATEARTYALYWPSMEEVKVQPLSMLGYAAANAFHVLASRSEVDDSRIGIVGHSFGGKWAMFASCLYEPFACAAWSDPGIVFDTRPSVNYWEPWYLGWHPQPWRKRGVVTEENPARGLYPDLLAGGRDLHELHALMAPRPFFVSGGSEDPPHRWIALNHTRKVNQLLGYSDRVAMHNRPEHGPNPESNELIYQFFEKWLGARKE